MYLIIGFLCLLPYLTNGQVDLQSIANGEFKRIDANNDGHIEKEEISQSFQAFDNNHDNKITRHEYDSGVNNLHPNDPFAVHVLTALFVELDSNNDKHLDDADYDKFFTNADTDKNNLVTSEEFISWFQNAEGLPIVG
ncbi:uncharacterized protein LOC106079636 [Biomphalaria glabrata]|uniref:Uncharacterized protein LOC106079636 n=1 Tax=Biomphalaria glabrata TaxID=6526 RepID=A0A9W3AYT0_BIOGL|nr:uncharacterized protein LOC106079636 [Biomphalaria glabrata]